MKNNLAWIYLKKHTFLAKGCSREKMIYSISDDTVHNSQAYTRQRLAKNKEPAIKKNRQNPTKLLNAKNSVSLS